nr:hypothetical protein [Tanacetum cinerariifolium]
MVSVDTMLNWNEHDAESKTEEAEQVYVQAHKNTVKTLELQKDWYHQTQLALEEKVRILSANLENTTNTLKYSETLNAQANIEKQEWEIKFVESQARTKPGLGFKEYIGSDEVCNFSTPSVFDPEPDNREVKSLSARFVKAGKMHAVLPPITGTFMPTSYQSDLAETQATFGSKSNTSSIPTSDSNDSTNDSFSTVDVKLLPKSDVKDPSLTNGLPSCSFKENVKPPRNLCNKSGTADRIPCKNTFVCTKKCFVYGSKSHLIKDCNVHDTVDNSPFVVSKAAYVPAGSRNSSASISAGRSITAGSRTRSASIHAGRSIPAASRNRSASFHILLLVEIDQHLFILVHQHVNKDIGIVYSGCSRSMTGNKEKLDDFVQVKGGIVTFGGGDGKITGRGTIRTSKLDFENVYYVEELQNFNMFSGYLSISLLMNTTVLPATKRKQHKASYKAISTARTIFEPLQLLHMDLFGPTSIRSIDHKYYFLVVTDDFKNQLNKKVKAFRCDNGTEFQNANLISLCGEKGIKRDYKAVSTACYVLHKVSITNPHNKTPYELLSGKKVEEMLNLRYLEDKPNVQGLGQEWYTTDDSKSECDEHVIFVPSFPSDSFSGPTVHDVSAPMENNLDYAEELTRLQRQEYKAHSAAAKHGFKFSVDTAWCDEFEVLMKGEFEMSAMGELTFFLGLQFDMESVRAATTPYEVPKHKSKDEPDDAVNVYLFRSIIGSLMYLTASRPDIMFAVSACSRHQVTPLTSHLNAIKKIFKYLKGQPNLVSCGLLLYFVSNVSGYPKLQDGPHMPLLAPMLVVPTAGVGADAVPAVRDPTPVRDPIPVREPTPSLVREPTPDSPRPPSPPPRTEEVGPTTSTRPPSPTRHTSVHEDISEGGGDFVSSPPSNEALQTPATTAAGGAEDSAALTALSLKLDRCLHRVTTLENELGITKKVLGGAVLKLVTRVKRKPFTSSASAHLSENIPAGASVPAAATTIPAGSSVDDVVHTAVAPSSSIPTAADKGKAPMVDDSIPADLLSEQARILKNLHDYQLGEELAKKIHAEQEVEFARQQEELAQKAQAERVASPTEHGPGMSDQRRQELDAAQLIYTEADWLELLAKIATNSALSKKLSGDDVTEENMNERLGMLLLRKRRELAEQSRIKPMTKTQQMDYMRDFVKNNSTSVYNQGWTMKKVNALSITQLRLEFEPKPTLNAPSAKRANQGAPQVPVASSQVPAGVPAALSFFVDVSIHAATSSAPADISIPAVSPAHAAISEMVPSPLGSVHAYHDMAGHTKHFTTLREILHMVEKTDLQKLLGASLDDEDALDFWRNQDSWRIRSWRLYPRAQVYVLETVDGRVILMFVDVSYPLTIATLERILKHRLEVPTLLVGGDLTMAEQLIGFIKVALLNAHSTV